MATDKNGKDLKVEDSVFYIFKNTPNTFVLRGTVSNIVPLGSANDGEMLYLVDVRVDYINKDKANGSQIVRVWSGELEKYDTERVVFV